MSITFGKPCFVDETDNYMDYINLSTKGDNIHKGKMFSFFKWQWDEIHKNKNENLIFEYNDTYKSFWDFF